MYLYYTNGLPLVIRLSLYLYADDSMVMCHSIRPAQAATVMQSIWTHSLSMALEVKDSHKHICNAICFRAKQRMRRAEPMPITLNG